MDERAYLKDGAFALQISVLHLLSIIYAECLVFYLRRNWRRENPLNSQEILQQIDSEILRLQKVKALLEGTDEKRRQGAGRSRRSKPGSAATIAVPAATTAAAPAGKRVLSPAARRKIAAAQRRRWARVRKAAEVR